MFCFSYSFAQNTLPSSGNVGIGTTNPTTELDVVGNTNLGGNVTIDSSVIVKDSATFQKKLTVNQDLKIKGTSVFVDDAKFKSELKVLGTAKMKDKLVVDGLTRMNGDANVFGNFRIKSLADSTFSTNRLLSINPNGRIVLSNLTIPQDDTFVCNYVTPWVFANGITTDDDIALCPNFKSVTIGGNLIIGGITRLNTTAIGVAADNEIQLNMRSVGKEVGFRLLTIPSTATTTTKYAFQNRVTTANIIAYSVTNHSTNQDVLKILGNGNIRIEQNASDLLKTITITDNVSGKDVFRLWSDGHIWATELDLALKEDFPDYVFESDYSLMALDELEKYITKNKHLPNIPSAKEVKKEGLSVGKMQVKQMEKIEELTLYIIAINKKVEKIEAENDVLKQRINKLQDEK